RLFRGWIPSAPSNRPALCAAVPDLGESDPHGSSARLPLRCRSLVVLRSARHAASSVRRATPFASTRCITSAASFLYSTAPGDFGAYVKIVSLYAGLSSSLTFFVIFVLNKTSPNTLRICPCVSFEIFV